MKEWASVQAPYQTFSVAAGQGWSASKRPRDSKPRACRQTSILVSGGGGVGGVHCRLIWGVAWTSNKCSSALKYCARQADSRQLKNSSSPLLSASNSRPTCLWLILCCGYLTCNRPYHSCSSIRLFVHMLVCPPENLAHKFTAINTDTQRQVSWLHVGEAMGVSQGSAVLCLRQ